MTRRPFTLAAVAATLLSATFAADPVAVAAPGDPNQVALFVQYPGGGTQHWCLPYRSGMSGADVLEVAAPDIGRSGPYAGFVLRIGGQGTVPPTDTDYWAYWVTQNGGLVYSGSGVTSTHPQAGTVEAWHWNSDGDQAKPQAGSYAALCPGGRSPAPAATTPAPTPTGVAAPTGSGGGGSAPTGGTTPGDENGSSAPGTAGSAGSATPGAAGSPAASTSTSPTESPTAGGSGTPGASTSVAASAVAATDDTGGLGAGSTVGLIATGVAVLALGALAVVARRRRAEQD